MTSTSTTARTTFELWGDGVRAEISWSPESPATMAIRSPADGRESVVPTQPLVEILAVGHGHVSANLRNTATSIGGRLRVSAHEDEEGDVWRTIRLHQVDPVTGLEVISTLRVRRGGSSLQSWTTVHNRGDAVVVLQAVSSCMLGDPAGRRPLEEVVTLEGRSEWLGESRWVERRVRDHDVLPYVHLAAHQKQDARGSRAVVSHGTWSSGERVPTGVVSATDGGLSLAWQIEHSGPWRMELAERLDDHGEGVLSLGLLGPTDVDHTWTRALAPGEQFQSVPVSVAGSGLGWQGAVGEMTRHRRALRSGQRASRAVVFNDYMNTLMGDPTTEKLLPLVDAAASVGADYFCVDAGWYDDGGDWWDSVGAWEPSTARFADGGLGRVLDHVRDAGMIPGLWLEPEVVGVRSPLATTLPDAAFMQRRGVRLEEHGRYLLDLRHHDARKHLDEVVDRLVADMGVGYFKLDYNVTPGVGTDLDADSPGDGLLRHVRAYQDWLDGVLARHPRLVVENCASGGMRADYSLLSRVELQSTSDQQDALLYPPIAAGALVSILPEQAGNWAYPQPGMSPQEIAFTMVTGLSGRLYLSGRLDEMSPAQLDLVRSGVHAARSWDDEALGSTPFWPLGLPSWNDGWVAVGRTCRSHSLVAIWARPGAADSIDIAVPAGSVEVVYPRVADDVWDIPVTTDGSLHIRRTDHEVGARLLRITHTPNI